MFYFYPYETRLAKGLDKNNKGQALQYCNYKLNEFLGYLARVISKGWVQIMLLGVQCYYIVFFCEVN